MAVGRFITPLDIHAVSYHAGGLLRLVAVVMAAAAVAALAFGDFGESALMAATAAAAAVAGLATRRGPAPALLLREAMALAALGYLLFAAAGAVAFLGVVGPVDALFESMSGFTTTGLTVTEPEELPRSLLLLRGLSQWVGGGGIILASLVVLTAPGSSAARLYEAEFGVENVVGSAVAMGRLVAVSYVGLTAAAYAALLVAGAGWFDGLVHALSLLSTGGFSPFGDSIGDYDSAPIAAVTAVFMVAGAVSFPLYYMVQRGDWRRLTGDAQLRAMAVLLAGGGLLFVAYEGLSEAGDAAFHTVSALTTTGFVLGDPADWSDGSRMLAVGLMAVGGSVGSTAGGIKLLRLLILVRMVGWAVTRVLMPREAKIPLKVQHAAVREDEVRRTFALAASYAALLFVSAMLLAGSGDAPFEGALFDAASAMGTVGLSVGVAAPDLAAWGKLLLTLDMWAGRLEILALLVLLHPRNWRG